MRRYLRTLWSALIGRPAADVEMSGVVRVRFHGHLRFTGRLVGVQADWDEGLGGATAVLTLHDQSHDLRLLHQRARRDDE